MLNMEKLTDVKYIKTLMREHGTEFKKRFGQNFLVNDSVLEDIAENADEGVLEIGPGIGSLTQKLCERAKKVAALEIDSELIPILNKTLAEYDNVSIINLDVMKTDIPELIKENFGNMSVSVCANLPYYITTPVIMLLLECGVKFSNITVMIQKEVAARLCALPGSADYGAITASVAYYAKAKRLFNVSSGNYVPAPKVDSSVVRLDLYKEPPVSCHDSDFLFKIIAAAFAQRRKTLVNALSSGLSISKEEAVNAIKSVGLDENIRGERLSIAEFAGLCNEIKGKK